MRHILAYDLELEINYKFQQIKNFSCLLEARNNQILNLMNFNAFGPKKMRFFYRKITYSF